MNHSEKGKTAVLTRDECPHRWRSSTDHLTRLWGGHLRSGVSARRGSASLDPPTRGATTASARRAGQADAEIEVMTVVEGIRGTRAKARIRWDRGRWSVAVEPGGSSLSIARRSFASLPDLVFWANHIVGGELAITDDHLARLWSEAGIAA